jgi:hypothetical protein
LGQSTRKRGTEGKGELFLEIEAATRNRVGPRDRSDVQARGERQRPDDREKRARR